jgi:hypothetical protein
MMAGNGRDTLAYYDTATIKSVKSFIVQAPGETQSQCTTNRFLKVRYNLNLTKTYNSLTMLNYLFQVLSTLRKKARVIVPGKHLEPNLLFVGKARSPPLKNFS